MPSENARAVAHEVLSAVRKGQKVSLRKIAKKHGYAPSVADKPQKITRTKSYQAIVKPVLSRYESHRDRILKALAEKDLSRERFRDLSDALAKSTHDIQLLSGRATENIASRVVHISDEKRSMADQALSAYIDEDPQGDPE